MISSAAAPRREPVPVLSVSAASLYKVVLISPLSPPVQSAGYEGNLECYETLPLMQSVFPVHERKAAQQG